jgi:hypothetical protein
LRQQRGSGGARRGSVQCRQISLRARARSEQPRWPRTLPRT